MIGYSLNLWNMLPWLTGKMKEEFKESPLLPEDFTWPELAQVIGEGKQNGPLFHYSGFLPYTMQTVQKSPNFQQRNIYKTYPPASWPHAFSCAHGCQNIYNESGRFGKMQKCYIYCRFLHWEPHWWFFKMGAKSKGCLVPWKKQNIIPTAISLFSMTMQLNISRRCQVNTRLKQPYRWKNLKQVSEHTLQI